MQDKTIMQKYMASLYWITQTIITVGYGDIGSETQTEKFLSIIAIFAGVIYFSLTVGSLTSLIQDAEQKSEQYERQVSLLKELKITYKLPSPLCNKAIRKIKQLVYNKEPNYSELLESLPISFRIELGYAMYNETLKDIDFFVSKPLKFIAFIGPLLTKVDVCQEEIIYSKDETANEMFFVKSGTVSLVLEEYDNFAYITIDEGYYFGETDLLFNNTRQFSVSADRPSVLLVLSKENFNKIFFEEFPQIGKDIYTNSLRRKRGQFDASVKAEEYCKEIAEIEKMAEQEEKMPLEKNFEATDKRGS
jgi:CRP-like cAMP-binding protein